MKQIRMNGIRLSNPQVGVFQTCPVGVVSPPVYLYHLLAEEQINITFLNLFAADGAPHINCCISPDKQARVEEFTLRGDSGIACRPRIGTVSVYPHQYSFSALGYLLYVFARERFSFYQMASSGAMLTFVVDYGDQEAIAAGLERRLDLPATRTPLRQEIDTDEILALYKKRPETSAEYVESRVRTYGINIRPGLMLCAMTITPDALADRGARIQTMDDLGLRFAFTSADTLPDGRIRLFFLFEDEPAEFPIDEESELKQSGFSGSSVFSGMTDDAFAVTPDVCLISLQGPHFGDRYGIADHAFSALVRGSVPLLIAGCVGAMIYIAVPGSQAQRSKALLSEVFETP